jgi:hypothetical protein
VVIYAHKYFFGLTNLSPKSESMGEKSLSQDIREQIGKNLKKRIDEKYDETALRKIDAFTGKDYSWIGKVQKGKRNFRIDSLINLLVALKIQPKDVFDFTIKFPKDE